MHYANFNKVPGKKPGWELHKSAACCFEYPGSNSPQNSSCTATYFPSHKPFT